MKAVIQRVAKASVTVNSNTVSAINTGLLVLIGIEEDDNPTDIDWLCNKIVNLRIFNDADGVMNLSLLDIMGELLLVSQFTLNASTKKGNRPSYIKAAKPDLAFPIYQQTISIFKELTKNRIKTGEFGAQMSVMLINDGPVTIIIDTKNKI